jgi:hypothetical protein
MKTILSVAGLALLGAALGCYPSNTAAEQDRKADDPPAKKAAECRWAKGRISINGRLDENSWFDAQEVTDFPVFWQKRKSRSATKARLLWDNNYLYFAAEMGDADLYALVKEKNGKTWNDDVFELFFRPGGDGKAGLHYYEFQVNPLNTQLELFFPSRGAGGYDRFVKDSNLGMETAVKIKGTLNNWKDTDEGWIVEGKIPWKAFAQTRPRPEPGARWRFALCRYDYSVAFDRPELSSTAPLPVSDFHAYEHYGELLFVGPPDR